MPPTPDPITQAVLAVLTRRATRLRQEAAKLATTTTDAEGRPVTIVPPEARVKVRTAALFDECAEAVAPTR